jgi:predicted transposase YdaD
VDTATPHDALFKAVFSRPEHAAGELRYLLPPPLAARIDWSALRLEPGTYIDKRLAGSASDLLFSAPCAGAELLIYLLFEHQSTHDPRMAFRLLRYMVRIWEVALAAEHPPARLPVILPLVLHHSERGWTSCTSFEALLDADAPTLALVRPYVPIFEFLLDDLSDERDEALRARALVSALGRLLLFCLRHAREPEVLFAELPGWVGLIRQVRAAPGGVEALWQVWAYIMAAGGREETPEAVAKMLVAVVGEESREEIMTAAQILEQRGWERGLARGREQGAREMLLMQLRTRFGDVPDGARARIEAATKARLEVWAQRVLTAGSVDEVLAEG